MWAWKAESKKSKGLLCFELESSVMHVLGCFQVIKFKLCRTTKKKGCNNQDRGVVLSLDDVKHHVSRLLLSTFTVSHCIALTRAHSSLSLSVWTVARVTEAKPWWKVRGGKYMWKRKLIGKRRSEIEREKRAWDCVTAHLFPSVNEAGSLYL